MARKTKLTDETIAEFRTLTARGASLSLAAAVVGCDDGSARRWLRRGRLLATEQREPTSEADRLCLALADAVFEGKKELHGRLLTVVLAAANGGNDRAKKWLAEHDYSDLVR